MSEAADLVDKLVSLAPQAMSAAEHSARVYAIVDLGVAFFFFVVGALVFGLCLRKAMLVKKGVEPPGPLIAGLLIGLGIGALGLLFFVLNIDAWIATFDPGAYIVHQLIAR